MKFFRLVSLVCLFVGLLCFYSFADSSVSGGAITSDTFETSSDSSSLTVVVNNPDTSSALSTIADYISSRDSENSVLPSYSEPLSLRSVNVSNETISASDANGFKAVVLDLLGDYTSIITDYTYSNTQGYTQHSIDVTPDWSWIVTAGIFIVVVFCAFRLIGGILCNR